MMPRLYRLGFLACCLVCVLLYAEAGVAIGFVPAPFRRSQ